MKFKNVREKIKFINSLEEKDNQSIRQYITVIYRLARDKNIEVRSLLAKQLVLFDGDEIEDILYDMLSDKNRMVRLEALDSLSIGRQYKTIEKVSGMLEGEGYLIRMYAVMTLFDLITNAYGEKEKAFEMYRELIEKNFQAEKNSRVLLAYYQNEYYMQQEKGLSLLKGFYVEAVDCKKYDLLWIILHIFKDIRNKKNQIELQQIMNYKLEELLPVQKTFVNDMIDENVECATLL